MEIKVGSKWKQGDATHVVKALASDGEVGWNHEHEAGDRPNHWCQAAVFLKDRTPVGEVTSPAVASTAAKLLQDPATPPEVRSVAASALTQAADRAGEKDQAAGEKLEHDADVALSKVPPGSSAAKRIEHQREEAKKAHTTESVLSKLRKGGKR